MIIPLPFIVSLLFTIIYATDFEYKIDWTACLDGSSNCYIHKWCMQGAVLADDKIMLHTYESEDLKEENYCDAIIQIRSISERHYLVIMEVKSAISDLDPTAGISIKQFGEIQLECKDSNAPTGNADLKLEYYGSNSHVFTEERMFCSIFVTTVDEQKTIAELFKKDVGTLTPSLEYSSKTPGTVLPPLTYNVNKDEFWKPSFVQCGMRNIDSADHIDDSYELKRVDMFQNPIKCPDDGKMRILYKGPAVNGAVPDPVERFESKLECSEVPCTRSVCVKKKYKFSPVIEKTGRYNIACVKTRFCSACDDTVPPLPEDCPEGMCKAATLGTDNGCKILKCDGENEWSFDGKESAVSDGPITCKKSATDPTKGGWFFKRHGDDPPTEYSKIACATIKSCDHTQFNFTCPEEIKEVCKKPDFDEAKFNFTCTQGYLQKGDGKGEALATVCDRSTGKWRDLEDTANIFCAPEAQTKSDANTGSETTSTGNIGATVGIALGVLIAVGAVVGSLYYVLVHKKKQDAKKTTKKEEGTSKKSSKKVESKSGGVGSSNEAKKEEKKSDPNKESEKPPADAAKEPAKDGKEAPKDGAEPPKDAAATPAAGAATPAAPATPGAAAPATPAADSAPAPADATPV